ncbi:MAG: hypothetical protein RIS46_1144, partial [Actinomycetota bacterium]
MTNPRTFPTPFVLTDSPKPTSKRTALRVLKLAVGCALGIRDARGSCLSPLGEQRDQHFVR